MKGGDKSRRNQPFCVRTFKCPVCESLAFASKVGSITKNGHKKKLYCPYCKKRRNMRQVDFETCK